MDKLTPELVAAGLGTRWLAHRIVYFESIGSTNDEARCLAQEGTPEGTLVVAEAQTAGRGRLQRRWLAPVGQALLFSLVFYPQIEPRAFFQLTMLASLSCLHAVRSQTGLTPQIKWPNDLLLHGRKLAGVLSELGQTAERLHGIVGIGLNVNVDFTPFPELHGQATSLCEVLGTTVPRLPLLQEILRWFENGYDRLRAGHSPYAEWSANLATLGQEVRVVTSEGSFTGRATSVDPDGTLHLTLADGTARRIMVGDVEHLR